MSDFLRKIKEKWQTVLVVVFSATALSFSISAFLPAQYLSEVSVLVIQKQTINKVDAFSAAKSAEYLSEILSQVIYSQSFLEDVLTAPFENKKQFSSDISERELQWKKTVETNKINNTGIIKIKVYATSRVEAERTAQSVAWALSVRGHKYHGGGDWVKIVTIDGPSTSVAPVKPNLPLNTLLGFLVGIGAAGSVVYFLEDFNLIIFHKKEKSLLKRQPLNFSQKNQPTGKKDELPIFLQEGSLSGEMLKRALNYSPEEDYRPFIKKRDFIFPPKEKMPIEESVRVIEPEKDSAASAEKKALAPDNLPIFEEPIEEKQEQLQKELSVDEKGFISLEQLKAAVQEKGTFQENGEGEPSEEEVRNRLNKLLKGDL